MSDNTSDENIESSVTDPRSSTGAAEDPGFEEKQGRNSIPENPDYGSQENDRAQDADDGTQANNNFNPMAIWHRNEVDANDLSPTYSMVSFCPFLGNCCFFPMNYLPPHQCGGGVSDDKPPAPVPEPKPVAEVPVALKEKPARVSLQKPSPAPFEPDRIEPVKPTEEPVVVFTQDSEDDLEERISFVQKIEVEVKKTVVPPKVEVKAKPPPPKQQGRNIAVVQQGPPVPPKMDEVVNDWSPKYKTTEIPKPNEVVEHGRATVNVMVHKPSALLVAQPIVNKTVDIRVLKKESLAAFTKEYKTLEPGIQGIKTLVAERSRMSTNGLLDFVDYFIKKDGTKYIGMLEQYFLEFYEKTATELSRNPGITKKAEEAKRRITDTFRIVQVELEKEIQDYNFPAQIEKDLRVLGVDVLNKIMLFGKIHNYGVQTVLYWAKLLDQKKAIDPWSIYNTGTELMADVMVLVYSVYTLIADYFVQLVAHPTPLQVEKYSLEFFIRTFRNIVDCISDEIGAIGESCGQIMIRIPNIPRETVIEVMTMLYKQVNYADVSMSRAQESIAPALHLYYIRYHLNREQNRKRIGSK